MLSDVGFLAPDDQWWVEVGMDPGMNQEWFEQVYTWGVEDSVQPEVGTRLTNEVWHTNPDEIGKEGSSL